MADDELRRSERDSLVQPHDEGARARLATARVRAGETPPALRALASLERASRGLWEFGARLAALSELAWAHQRLGVPGRAGELAQEVAAGPPLPDRAQPDLSIRALARAGATFCRTGDEDRGRDLLSRAGIALGEVDEPWGELGSIHARLLRALDDAGAGDLVHGLPGLARSLRALARRGQDLLTDRTLVEALERLGLRERVAAELAACLGEPHTSLWERARGIRALEALGALGEAPARGMLVAMDAAVAGQGPPEETLDGSSIAAAASCLDALGEDGRERFLRWGRELDGERLEEALLLHAARPGTPDLPWLEHLLEQALGLEAGAARARVLPALLRRVEELPAPDPDRAREFVARALLLAPTAARERAVVLQATVGALAALSEPVRIGVLARSLARELRETENDMPRWLLLEPLTRAAEHMARAGRSPALVAASRVARSLLDSDIPAAVFHALLSLARCAGATRREDWCDEALEGLAQLIGQDLEDAASALASQLGAHDDAPWRAEGLARLAAALESHPGPGPPRHLVEPIARVAALLEPPA